MKSLIIVLAAATSLVSACVVVPDPPHRDEVHRGGDRDRDGIPNRADRDRDGDGVRNRNDRYPDNRRRD
ncbi:MAG: hypothetical protein JWL63_635 [Rhodocyclales bacterium]|nr:hypothetical protein [Rhodocyclales bacterium]